MSKPSAKKPTIVQPKEEKSIRLTIQAEFMGLCDIEPYDEEQKIFKGKLIPTSRVGQWSNITDRDWIFFSRDYNPENNDIDTIYKEIDFRDDITGYTFILVPGNKIRMFYVPESIIKLGGPAKGVLV